MRRRLLFTAMAAWPATAAWADDTTARPRHRIPAERLYAALEQRFPLRFGLGGVLELQVSAPRLLLLPARNLLGATLLAEVGGSGARQQPAGELDLVFALRYEPADQTVRAHRPEVLDLRWPGLPADQRQALVALLPLVARNVGEVVLHRLTPRELGLADSLGFEPQELRVVDDGLLVLFAPKARR